MNFQGWNRFYCTKMLVPIDNAGALCVYVKDYICRTVTHSSAGRQVCTDNFDWLLQVNVAIRIRHLDLVSRAKEKIKEKSVQQISKVLFCFFCVAPGHVEMCVRLVLRSTKKKPNLCTRSR